MSKVRKSDTLFHMTTARRFNWLVIDVLATAIAESRLSQAEIIQRSGMRRTTYFSKMRGDTALTTDDIAALASALDLEPDLVLSQAAEVRWIGDSLPQNTDVLVASMAERPSLTEMRAAERLSISVNRLRELTYEAWGMSLDSYIREDAGPNANAQARGHANRRAVAALEAILARASVGTMTEDDIHRTPEGPKSGYALAAKRGTKKANQPYAE